MAVVGIGVADGVAARLDTAALWNGGGEKIATSPAEGEAPNGMGPSSTCFVGADGGSCCVGAAAGSMGGVDGCNNGSSKGTLRDIVARAE